MKWACKLCGAEAAIVNGRYSTTHLRLTRVDGETIDCPAVTEQMTEFVRMRTPVDLKEVLHGVMAELRRK